MEVWKWKLNNISINTSFWYKILQVLERWQITSEVTKIKLRMEVKQRKFNSIKTFLEWSIKKILEWSITVKTRQYKHIFRMKYNSEK